MCELWSDERLDARIRELEYKLNNAMSMSAEDRYQTELSELYAERDKRRKDNC